ncbi:unnamed protein product [Taenia asiatica]|uniref:Expressed conserved protein n=1 Tax=Taenia asiatica TaxID=60517 RepID=A0A0R3WG38_TAEAS|nr:unnamed protein product [Taenia asiatica]
MATRSSEQRGLPSLEGKSNLMPQSGKPTTGLQIYHDAKGPTDFPNRRPVHSGASDLGKSLSRLAEPVASWNVENVGTPIARLDRRTALSSTSVLMPTSQPRTLTIYRDPSEKDIGSSRSSSRACQPSTSTRPRGLRLVTKEGKHSQQHDSLLYSFECLKSALLAKQMSGMKEAADAVEDSEFSMEFFCDVDALYSHNEETCFEMNRVLNDVHPSHAIEDDFSLNLDDPHSKSWIGEIERIISGDYSEEEEVARTRPAKRHG